MEWFGTVIGMFSIAALVLRPLINPFLRPGNARLWMMLGTAGIFFTISIITEITIRVFAGRLFDRINKTFLAVASFLAIGIGYVFLAHLSGTTMLYALGVFLGLGWGVIMPILNALMFDVSPVRLKGFNTNLGMQMFQAGFFVGPLAGGTILTCAGFRGLYYFCAGCAFCAMMLAPLIRVKGKKENPEMKRRGFPDSAPDKTQGIHRG